MLCIEQETLNSTCELTNVTCICTNVELVEKISLCVHANCTVRDSLLAQSYSKHTCGAPSRDRTHLVWIIGVVFLALGLLGFMLRIVARFWVGAQTWGSDDWVMLLAVLLMIPLNAISIPISRAGMGKDVWNLESPDDITDFLYIFYWGALLYLGVLPITKISILLFYVKVFPSKVTRIACWIFIGLNVAYFIVFELVSIFQCTPIEGAWKAWDKEFPAKCNNVNVQGWTAAMINIVLDLGTLIIPLRDLYNLMLSRQKKIQLMLMFSIGIFVTIISAVRLQSLATYATTENPTQDYVEIGYWSTIEAPVGIFCACMPAIRSVFSLVFPKIFGTTNRATSSYANVSKQSKYLSNPASRADTKVSVKWRCQDDSSVTEPPSIALKDYEEPHLSETDCGTPDEHV